VARRARWLRTNPLCVLCKVDGFFTRAVEVDHVIPLHQGGKDDATNLQSLCRECHERKTRTDLGQRERKTIGLNGWPL
jgi:5-methylcytosine-specific restriction protein A